MKHKGQDAKASRGAFTLIELLVIIATLGVLGLLLVPALAGTKPNTRAFQCMENQRRIMLSWRMYADDNNDLLPPNDYPYMTSFIVSANKDQLRNWVVGTMQNPFDAVSDPRGTLLAPQTLLSPYIKTPGTYKCPAADTTMVQGRRLNRNYSMSGAVGTRWSSGYGQLGADPSKHVGDAVGGGWLSGTYFDPDPNFKTFGKLSQFISPGPASTWAIIDENPLSINDGMFAVSMDPTTIIDYPSGLHAGTAGIAFADGHAELHRWTSTAVYTPSTVAQQGSVSSSTLPPGSARQDMAWLAAHTTVHR